MIALTSRFSPLVALLPAAAFFGFALCLTFTRAIHERIYMDEQLFLGGAGLMARGEGLIYRDFFYNHMPTHALLMAGLFRVTKHWTLAARTFDALCGAAIAAVLFEAARRAFVGTTAGWRVALAAAVGCIFLFNPATADAVGKAWNHDLAALACVVGFILLSVGLGEPRPAWWAFASGACAAIAVTTRLTYAPPLIAFPLLILLAPAHSLAARLRLLGFWTIGGIVGAAPSIYVFLQAPAAFYFDNVSFPGLTARYHASGSRSGRGSLSSKFEFIQRIVGRSWSLQILVWLTLACMLAAVRPLRVRASIVHGRFACVVAMVLAACFAAFVPTPMFHQYLYGPVPFAVLAIAWGAAILRVETRWWSRVALIGLAIACVHHGRPSYRGIETIASPASWTPNQWHRDGKRLARLAGDGKVLTFVPGLALEAGLPIYTELSIGRYAIRIADYLTPQQRAHLHVPDLADVRRWFSEDPPAAVLLVDPTASLEASLAEIALEHGYTSRSFGDKRTLLLPPQGP